MKEKESSIIHLKAAAKLVYQLGEQLIESEIVALLELIKNSYDADATRVYIDVDTNIMTNYGRGIIKIKDNGNGMISKTLEEDFFKIATSFKNKNKYSFKFGRKVLGEKGLGRLSFQRLGYYIRIITKPNKEVLSKFFPESELEELKKYKCFELLIDWRSLNTDLELHQVTATLNKLEEDLIEKESGTEIEVLGIRNINFWEVSEKEQKAIVQEIYKINSPFIDEKIKDKFKVVMKINNNKFSNDELNDDILEGIYDSKVTFRYKNGKYYIKGELSEKYLKGMIEKGIKRIQKNDRDLNNNLNFRIINYKKLEELKQYSVEIDINKILLTLKGDEEQKEKLSNQELEYLRFIKNANLNLNNNFSLITPGNFYGKLYNIRFVQEARKEIGDYIKTLSLNNIKDYNAFKNVWDQIQGMYVYKNSFRILPYGNQGLDWAGFDEYNRKVSYGPYESKSILGYLVLEEGETDKLREQTNRQGFMKDEYGDNFIKLIKNILVYIISDKISKILKGFDLKQTSESIMTSLNNVYEVEIPVKHYEKAIESVQRVKNNIEILKKIEKEQNSLNKIEILEDNKQEKVIKQIEELKENIEKAEKNIEKAYAEKKYSINILKEEKKEISTLIPLVGQSLIVESMTHELNRIASNILENAKKTIKGIEEELEKSKLKYWQNSIITETIFLEEQLGHLEPMYRKNNKLIENINVKTLLIEQYKKESPMARKAEKNNVKVEITGDEFYINANKGFLITVFDNLFLNSLYWVNLNNKIEKKIIIDLSANGVLTFEDNGPGIEVNDQNLIFKPFISKKADGRGLGLYIVENLLNEMNARITLSDEKNIEGNLKKFILKFKVAELKNTLF
ncbi:ATP-binding protein [Cetobacterium sp.]|uniref:ATP-binding protein n=1 Tax=Cetobacterium sp. TaxID=2071632 RepID=UPI003F36CFD2